jgi:hypothetical protein
MYKATIVLDDPDLLKVLQTEKCLNNSRATSIIKKDYIKINSKDIIAFKSAINGIIKIIEAYEKTSSLLK